MTTLKTVKEVASDAMSSVGWTDSYSALFHAQKIITEDRQATADVLCALLEGRKIEPIPDANGADITNEMIWFNETLTLAQDIIRATLSNKDV